MKLSLLIAASALSGLGFARPAVVAERSELIVRQVSGTVKNDLLQDTTCRPYYLIIARGSTEADNIGSTVGPALCSGLQSALGASKIGCQGIGNAQGYTASLADNTPTYDGGILTSKSAVAGAASIFNQVNTKCPNSKVVATGYSQGTAVLYNSIEALPANVKSKILGVTLFGYTANVPNKGQIPNYPASQTKVFCSDSLGADGVCTASEITVNAAHLDYSSQYANGVAFLKGVIPA
ncbi:carbohydrate esterase family 5 protein [Myriangium duriaei CBS 260.36]|uniref:cutinase n=1 Tax=Myriangium duriaei CBS 260.36 TaxID=1168546 RepID=A0A9P4MHW6_9PEZI|nr:carbohydrate esterase family 5 protein [Myriangium duriaei CBS 260.36]